jgi:predicted kinase
MDRPALILLCGIPGSGKTYYAEQLLKDNYYKDRIIHLSSDRIRKELYGDESTQGNPNEVFSLMQKRAVEALNNGLDVIYDSTAMTRKDRAGIIAACPKFAKIQCTIVWAPIETCIERDAARERTVGKDVIDRMLKRFQAPYYDEGIHEIKVIWNTTDDFNPSVYVDNLINASDIPHDNPHHTLNIKEHCNEAYHYAVNHNFPSYLLMAAKYHDIGKPYVKAFIDSKGNPSEHAHYYQHQCISAYMYYGIDKHNFFIAWLISTHMDPFLNTKYYNKLPTYLKKQVDLLHEADLAAH